MEVKNAFATCVQLGLSCIEEIYNIGGKLDLLITLNDDKAINKSGRIYLDEIAKRYDIPLVKINNINDNEAKNVLRKYNIDWLFVIGWSQIVKKDTLNIPNKGCIGMHPSLLPIGRGRAAIPWAILKGLKKTGVTMFKIDEGIDTGDIIGQEIIELDNEITASTLYKKAEKAHITLIKRYWEKICDNRIALIKQNEKEATQWKKRTPEDGEIDSSMSMSEAEKLVRAVTHPYPGAFYRDKDKIIRIWKAKVSPNNGPIRLLDGYLIPEKFQVE